jgi:general secretion pathway protein L
LQDCAVIRLKEGRLAWYQPGAGDDGQFLDDEVVRDELQAVLRQPGYTICFAVPGVDARLCQLTISPEERKHLEKSLPFMLEEDLVGDIEDLHFAWTLRDKLELIVAICSKSNMHHWQGILADFPGVNRWLPESMLLPWQSGEWCVLVEEGLAVVRTGFHEGFSIEKDMLSFVLAAAIKESADLPQAIIVYGQDQERDTALIPEEIRDRVQWRRGELGSALLLAQSPSLSANLLQGEFAVRLPLARWWKQWRTVAAVMALAFCAHLVATYAEFASLQRENQALRLAVEQNYREAYPKGALVDAEKQLNRQLGALRGSNQASGFVSLLSRVGKVISGTPGTTIASMNYSDRSGEVRLNITANNYEVVDEIRTALNRAGMSATMESSNAQGEKVQARMRVGAGS